MEVFQWHPSATAIYDVLSAAAALVLPSSLRVTLSVDE